MKIRWRVLKGHPESFFLALDLLVLVLISANLLWLLLDAILLNTGSGLMIGEHFPAFHQHYRDYWHPRLLVYDTFFTLFLLAELALRWGVAIYRQTYHRWFFYPFVHWYDVLGCIPIPGFRLLRLLRLISILYRLQTLGVINLAEGGLFRVLYKYYRMVLEELSDRIVINVLEGVQREVKQLGPVSHNLMEKVVSPRREAIVSWLASRLGEVSRHAMHEQEAHLGRYLNGVVDEAFAQNPEVRRLAGSVPIIGPRLEQELRLIVSGLLLDISSRIIHDAGRPGNEAMQDIAAALFDTLTRSEEGMNEAMHDILMDAIELIKDKIEVQQWKLDELGQPPPA